MGNPKLKLLIVEDDEDDVVLIREFLREGFYDNVPRMDWAASSSQAFDMIQSNAYDACLFDFRLGANSGIELLRKVRAQGHRMPIIFLTGMGDHEIAVETMKAGATDYLAKSSLTAEILSQAIHHSIQREKEKDRLRNTENTLYTQDRLLQAVSEATTCLLTRRDHAGAIQEALAILGKATDAECAFVYQHVDQADGKRGFVRCFAWHNRFDAETQQEELFPEKNYSDLGLEPCYFELRLGHFVSLPAQEFSDDIQRLLEKQDLTLITLVPIVIDDKYWGFVAFGNRGPKKTWSKNEQSMLMAVAASIGSEIRRHNDQAAFHSIVEGTSARVGDDFFRSLVRHLASALPVKNAYVSELVGYKSTECSILAGWENGQFMTDQNFNVEDTPYEEVLAGMLAYHPDGAQELFKGRDRLASGSSRSYAAVPCFDSHCKIIGHLSVFDDKPMSNKQRTMSILKVFASRAGAELERKHTEGLIRNMAYHDALTGLPNRILLSDRLEMALAQAQRSQSMLAILFLDFDHFKEINDTQGHAVGDQLLKGVGERLKKCLRNQDTVARLGGDEFILLLPEINSPQDAGNLANKLLDVVRAPFQINDQEIRISFSIGVALYPRDGETSNTLMKHADEALYLAKKQGKNCYQFYRSPKMPPMR